MDLINDPTFKEKYRKNKLTVKRWENDFKGKYGRKPSKDDIRIADDAIKESYKMYYKLKTKALDETLSDITFSDESRCNVTANECGEAACCNALSSVCSPILDVSHESTSSENIDPEKQQRDVSTSPPDEPEEPSTDSIPRPSDGTSRDKDRDERRRTKKKTAGTMLRSSSFQLSRKLFSSSNLTKRNPRKSLSTSKPRGERSDADSVVREETSAESCVDGFDPTTSIFGDTLKVVQGKTSIACHPTNAIRQLIEGARTTTDRNIDRGWLERCARDKNSHETGVPSSTFVQQSRQRSSGTSDSGVECMDTSDPTVLVDSVIGAASASADIGDVTDSEDFVCNSDSEDERKRFRRNAESKDARPSKRPCLVGIDETRSVRGSPGKKEESSNPGIVTSVDLKPRMEREETSSEDRIALTEETRIPSEPNATTKSEGMQEQQEEEEKAPKRKKRVARTTRTREKNNVVGKRVAKNTRNTRKRTAAVEEKPEIERDDLEDPSIPLYTVEAASVVPRFAMPVSARGDLVDDFSRCLVDGKLAPPDEASAGLETGRSTSGLTAREKLERKVASGAINENFVRINIKKKVFVRGKKHISGTKYRRDQWKKRRKIMDLPSSDRALDLADFAERNGGACTLCGERAGHVANRCPSAKSQELLPMPSDSEAEEESKFLTLEESEKLASMNFDEWSIERSTENIAVSTEISSPPSKLESHKIPEELLAKLLPPSRNGPVDPVFPVSPNGSEIETPDKVFQTLRMFGHEKFRPGQEKAIMRILSGRSTLVTLSTGSGKSLCYQLPAYLYAKRSRCVTLVVSPLVSLMDDQVTGVPEFLSAAALHTGQTPSTRERIIRTIEAGELDILLVSPEAVVASEGSNAGMGALLSRRLPPIAFACIDEAHCISQWSHNFRPSYLTVCRVLVEKLGVRTILGLTATATRQTAESIVRHLNIPDGISGIISDSPMPDNLVLSVSKDEHRDRALVELFYGDRFKDCDSIIVYCTRRDECTRIAGLLRASLQYGQRAAEAPTKKTVKCSPCAEAYHAGLTAARRRIVQRSFMSGETRIVVATVAFGMGINKSDIRSVVHYNMPASFESYVQEVGRAGRDGLPAHCHLFLAPSRDADKLELRRHIFANGVDRHTIRRLLRKIFVPCSCPRHADEGTRCPGHEVAIPIEETVRSLDITEETISTLLCYLELHPRRFVTVLSSVYTRARVTSYAGAAAIRNVAKTSAPLAFALALETKKGTSDAKKTVVEFPVVDVASAIGWDSGIVKSHLKNLEWQTAGGARKRSTISVQYDTLGFRVRAPGDLSDAELDEALEALAGRARSQEIAALNQLETIHASLDKFSRETVKRCIVLDDDLTSRSESLKSTIREYFSSGLPPSNVELSSPNETPVNEAEIIGDVRSLIMSYRDNNFTGRAVARIFHGIQSPNYSALTWSRSRFWRLHLSKDFNAICKIATKEILAMR